MAKSKNIAAVIGIIEKAVINKSWSYAKLTKHLKKGENTLHRWRSGKIASFDIDALVKLFEIAGESMDETFGITPDLVPPRFVAESIIASLAEIGDLKDKRILLPRADIAPDEFPEALTAAGARVTQVTAYRTLPGQPEDEVLTALRDGDVDIVTFTSSSTAANYAAVTRSELGSVPTGPEYVSIGPETTKAAQAEDIEVRAESQVHTIQGLIQAILERFGKTQS